MEADAERPLAPPVPFSVRDVEGLDLISKVPASSKMTRMCWLLLFFFDTC